MVYTLFGIFLVKHFIADFPLQGQYHIGKFKKYPDFILPLLNHCAIHAIFTFIISCTFLKDAEKAFWLGCFDLLCHFGMDRIKASPDLLGRFKALSAAEYVKCVKGEANQDFHTAKAAYEKLRSNRLFWVSLGIDQMVHGFTDLIIVYAIFH